VQISNRVSGAFLIHLGAAAVHAGSRALRRVEAPRNRAYKRTAHRSIGRHSQTQ
jgi:hypothetical protein